jgi:hypothetical protein
VNRKMRSKLNNERARKAKEYRARYSDSMKSIDLEIGQTVNVEGQEYILTRADGSTAPRSKLN